MERLSEGSKTENYDSRLSAGHGKQNDALYILHGGLVDTVSHNKTLPCDGYKPWELNLTLKIQQLLGRHIVYLQCEEAVKGFLPSTILF